MKRRFIYGLRSALIVAAVAVLATLSSGSGLVSHNARLVLAAVVLMFAAPGIAGWIEQKLPNLVVPTFIVGLSSALFLLAVGVDMSFGWVDPIALNPHGMDNVRLHGKQALVVPLIEYWPYVLILVGGFFAWVSGVIVQQRLTQKP